MTVKPVLWTYEPRQDGTCDIKLYISHNNKKKYKTTGIKLLPKDWDAKRQQVRRSHPLATRINASLQRQMLEITSHLLEGGQVHTLGKQNQSGSLVDFLTHILNDIDQGKLGLAAGTAKNYRSFQTRLLEYLQYANLDDLTFDDVTLEFYYSFRDFLVDECNCSLKGGFSKHIKVLKALMSRAQRRNLHTNTAFQHPDFRRYRTLESNKIYLTESEITALVQLDLSHDPHLALERDRFVVSYYFVLRHGDSLRIQPDHFFIGDDGNRYYRLFRSEKTDHSPVLPVKPLVWDILQQRAFDLSGDTNQERNRKLKTIASMAGISQQVEQDGHRAPKWRFVTTHTARRSAATNLRLRGIDLKTIADLGGWKSTEQLRVYLRASAIDSARVASRSSFFE